jgi:glucose-6-phosphate 1-dehydrogenase
MDDQSNSAADLLVIFGITGDLARKMTFRALYRLEKRDRLGCPIVGVASDNITTEQLVQDARKAIADSGQDVDDAVFDRFARRLSYLQGDVTDAGLYRRLTAQIDGSKRPLYYLEVPPALFGPIVERLGAAQLLRDGRVAVEKPFGQDLTSARELNARLHRLLRESQILRVDHFLAKEPVAGLEYLRFANVALAELWDRRTVSAVQITMAEDFGVEGRGRFYDSVGALRDVVQNHLMQVLALVAMDPPAGASADDTQDKKAEVFRAMPPADPAHYVRGQYQGYADIPGVAAGSATETYVALRLEIDNWRWADVPIFLRAGKALPHTVTEVRLLLRRTPRLAFLSRPAKADPNQIVLRIDPDPGLRLQLTALAEQSWRPVHLDTSFVRELGEPAEPYERLLDAALVGDHQLFAREDGVEETWRIVQPLLESPPGVRPYPRGSWGPDDADILVRGHPRWQEPWLPAEG